MFVQDFPSFSMESPTLQEIPVPGKLVTVLLHPRDSELWLLGWNPIS